MTPDVTLLSAFLVGLLGSTHCVGMCGGIVGALTLGLPTEVRARRWRLFPYLAAYNAGRIATYAVAGAFMGLLGSGIWGTAGPTPARSIASVVSGGFMIALGLYLAGWWPGLTLLERWGGIAWRRVEPLGRRLLPVRHPLRAFGMGLVWGWLPCGMVYAVLAWSLTAGGAAEGAALMAAFGLGTLPMLLLLGAAADWFSRAVRVPLVRATVGALVIGFGLYTVAFPWLVHAPPHRQHAPLVHPR